ncbi:MAG: NUDIX hydrolase, partial [Leptospiraceae bacterium]|nr:NUDIX hydrolase [Leptospiraceae bacterium]
GMCDNESDPFKVAVKEVEEETGLQISENQIIHLHKGKLYNSPGLLDEAGYFFACEVEMSGEEIKQFHDKTMGEEHEHEYIQTVICPFEEALSLIKNANGLLSIMLYQDYCNKN